jgi:hypothetical protein
MSNIGVKGFGRLFQLLVVVLVLHLAVSGVCFGDQPALPSGLGGGGNSNADTEGDGPALPAGLGESTQNGNHNSGPDLPSGLAGEKHQDQKSRKPDRQGQEKVGDDAANFLKKFHPDWLNVNGFIEVRAGYRLQEDKHQPDASIGETRLQLQMDTVWKEYLFEFTGDFYYDWVDENQSVDLERGEGFFDLRNASVSFSPTDFMDVKIGRQILTWGTGDLLFINDMFPKDWQSFFIGRDTEYLKATSDAIKASFFTDIANVDIVYTPSFDSDRYITGERNSYWNGSRIAGQEDYVETEKPKGWFDDDELALRVSKVVSGYELAAYGYWGYWKSPAGFDLNSMKYTFPRLNVYGASIRGQVGRGIGNIEVGYYDSRHDRSGDEPWIDNSQMRYLVGYEQDLPEIARDLTIGLQYYVEQMLGYDDYLRTLPAGTPEADEYRQLLTFRITKLYWNQTLTCSMFTYYSPTDRDAYMRPNLHYKVTDNLAVELGANVFWGDYDHTFFGQFKNNTNIYTAIRYSF